MTNPTTPPASGAAQMREAARRKIDLRICEAPHGTPGPGRDALIAARDATAALPLPAEPHAKQIAALPCGHHHSLGVRNIGSNVVFCELCEARDELRDALTMERNLGEKVRQQAKQIAVLTRAARDALAEIERLDRALLARIYAIK